MAVLKGSKICLGTLNMRLKDMNNNKAHQKLNFIGSLESREFI